MSTDYLLGLTDDPHPAVQLPNGVDPPAVSSPDLPGWAGLSARSRRAVRQMVDELAESERAASARAPSRFAQWLAEALAERGWSQRELARRIGTSPESVSRWNRRVRPAPARCEAIARELDVAPEEVLMLAGHDTAAPEP